MTERNLAALIILDGFAFRDEENGNAVKLAHKPNFDRYWNNYPHETLQASGNAVGLPEGQMGNSEVGHLNIGAGRIVYQSLTRINLAIEKHDFYKKAAFIAAVRKARDTGKALHLLGLLSDGGVHSHINHLYALLQLAKDEGLTRVYVHGFLDGRDVGQKTALLYIKAVEAKMREIGVGSFATVTGRYYAMDRDKRWERVKLAYDVMTAGNGEKYTSAADAVQASYDKGITDEFVHPSVIVNDDGKPVGQIDSGDSAIFFNFRPDRAIQLSLALGNEDFIGFDRGTAKPEDLYFVMMLPYSDAIHGETGFEPINLNNTVGEVLSKHHMQQLRIAETEKYPHVTFFMSGGREEEFPGEKRILINSPKVATYDLKPEMSAYEVTGALLEELDREDLNAVILNFANPDMVGHSGMLEPTIKAIEVVDECLGKIVDKIITLGGTAIITADHGNSDEVLTKEDMPMTAHTTNPVPIIVTRPNIELQAGGILADLSPTLLDLLNVEKPEDMTGKSLIKQ